jgi:hypothetical protein
MLPVSERMTPMGSERSGDSGQNTGVSGSAGSKSGNSVLDPDLAAVVEVWERLPEAMRAGIAAMVRVVGKG